MIAKIFKHMTLSISGSNILSGPDKREPDPHQAALDQVNSSFDTHIQRAEDFVTHLNTQLDNMTTVGPHIPATYTVTPAAQERLQEKQSLQIINDRLGTYVQQVGLVLRQNIHTG